MWPLRLIRIKSKSVVETQDSAEGEGFIKVRLPAFLNARLGAVSRVLRAPTSSAARPKWALLLHRSLAG